MVDEEFDSKIVIDIKVKEKKLKRKIFWKIREILNV